MEFQVNDQTYFLTVADDERRWCFSVSTPHGARPLDVYVDAPESAPHIVFEEDKPTALN
ncbi:MAG: hypothetical protein WCA16_20205 [Candidatus Sulfotelmatobacter sp.]